MNNDLDNRLCACGCNRIIKRRKAKEHNRVWAEGMKRWKARKYYSKECSNKVQAQRRKHNSLETKTCQHCGTTITRGSTQGYKWKRKKYCSKKCASTVNMTKVRAKMKAQHEKEEAAFNGRSCTKCGRPLTRKKYSGGFKEALHKYAMRTTCRSYECNDGTANKKPRERTTKPKPKAKPLTQNPPNKKAFTCKKHGMGVSKTGTCPTCNGGTKMKPKPWYEKTRKAQQDNWIQHEALW